ncbi:MAG: hypothetical protein OXK81_12295 [Chloroflexota bacterium]|nr:hypothetical protein [Chloroflexota bacterium]MDE2929411.1 hypothetical protein [Chloroflexota bacterium]
MERGYFASPPQVLHLPNGHMQFPFWPELQYLKNVCRLVPEEVVSILAGLPSVDNPHVYVELLEIAIDLPGSHSAKLKGKMLEYAGLSFQTMAHGYPSLLAHWAKESETLAALELAEVLIQFKPDPKAREKRRQFRKNPSDFTSFLDPSPRFEKWDYREILNSGVRPLAEIEPYGTACILIDAVAAMIDLGVHPEQLDTIGDRDTSEFWCRRLNRASTDYGDNKEDLANALTFACEQVYEKAPASIADLDEHLRKQRWKIFKRLRQHLFALNPSEVTKPWIRNLVLEHQDYGRTEHHYEFQKMVRSACARFGEELLTKQEWSFIFDTILDGPPKEEFLKLHGEKFTEEKFELRQLRFHRMQLRLFEDVLFGDYLARFQEAEMQADEQISNDDYLPFGDAVIGFMSARSPKPPEQLATMGDADILGFINEWDAEHYDDDDPLVEVIIEALAKAFQEFFTDSVLPNADRFQFWIENRREIARPIYVRAIVDGMKDAIAGRNFERLEESLEFCEWVLSHPDQERETDFGNGDQSRNNPLWASSRRAVVDLIGACLEKDVDVPYSHREHLTKLLDMLCTQFDWRLDRNRPVLVTGGDQYTEAINNTRSRALERLIELGFWIRRRDANADLDAVTAILEKRFAPKTEFALTLPERAILGASYARLLYLERAWATAHRTGFFPQTSVPLWREAFGSFLQYTRPSKPSFEVLQDDYDYAVQHLADYRGQDDSDTDFPDYLAQHLFFYYLWGLIPLRGDASLLEGFYRRTNEDRKRWSNLIDHLGRKLENTKEHLDGDLKRGLVEFFGWRLDAGDAEELGYFASWLKAECLEADWRLDAFSRVLDATNGSTSRAVSIAAKALEEMLPDHTNKVVECFVKLTDTPQDSTFYVNVETAKRIIQAGLQSNDEGAQENAKRARENLLRRGFFDLRNVED